MIHLIIFGVKKMISLRQIRGLFLIMVLGVMLVITIAYDFGSSDTWLATSHTQLISPPQTQITSMNRAEAVTKNLQGPTEAAIATGQMIPD
ncbi:hypothetical protein [Neosynechococcus sphagnicola]|uniref:hypothetical protein n=1 Tax=Neosynechococcus sphagnicola TaxID=1501145 RepID=UPI00195527EC|nr:hypothetical protein [Neosynechococcus sphagnicola]